MRALIRTTRIVAWLLAVIVVVLSVVPPALRPESGAPHNLEHFAAFFATGLAFGFGYDRRPVAVTFGLVLFSGMIEIMQLFVSSRHSRLSDFIVDAFAACVGVALAAFAVRTFWTKFPNLVP
jgi:VanZ family protein